MAGREVRRACGGEPHVFPPHLQAQREQMRIRAVEMGLRRPDQPLQSLCGECILERLAAFLADEDIDEPGDESESDDVDQWIDGIRERMAREERR